MTLLKRRMIMKTTRRFIAMTAALTLTACVAMPAAMMTASAASQNVTVSVQTDGTKDNNEGQKPSADTATHTYTAYEIFTGEYKQTAGADTTDNTADDKYEFEITGFGSGVNWTALLSTGSTFMNLTPDGTNTIADVIDDLGASATDLQKAKAIAQVLGDNITGNSAEADALAKIFAAAKAGNGTTITTSGTTLTEGYYLITDSYTSSADTSDAQSKFILQVAKKQGSESITIVPKKSYPTLIKKVKENVNDPTGNVTINGQDQTTDTTAKYNDVADYDIGSAVPFKLYGSMPATLGDYAHYYYKFTDTLGPQFDQPTNITITIGTTTLTAAWDATNSKYTITGDTGTNCRVKWDATNKQLTISFEDIKAYTGVAADTIVTVEYTAVLNDTANIGLPGQTNAAKLTYSNNPNFEYTPHTDDAKEDKPTNPGPTDSPNDDFDETDDTPEDKVIVFTYELDVTKIDGTTKVTLPGAEFTLQNSSNKYAKVASDGKFLGWVDTTVTDTAGSTTLTSDANGLFKIIGIDDGTYTLTETKAPGNYNQLTSPVTLTLDATTVNNQLWDDFVAANALTSLKLNGEAQDEGTATGNRGQAAKTIENNKGTQLPATGGIGTTLFILGGGCAAGIGGIYLISKKRTGKEE
jgi:fimbrial isopeptide formation D2 family protein/LPXTG-motif cell wall-anchored protein